MSETILSFWAFVLSLSLSFDYIKATLFERPIKKFINFLDEWHFNDLFIPKSSCA